MAATGSVVPRVVPGTLLLDLWRRSYAGGPHRGVQRVSQGTCHVDREVRHEALDGLLDLLDEGRPIRLGVLRARQLLQRHTIGRIHAEHTHIAFSLAKS